jgi:phosphoribosylformylglycinamidine synthase
MLDEFKRLLELKFGIEVVIAWHTDQSLQNAELIILPGGTSFGDYLRPGALARTSALTRLLRTHIQKGGKALGIGNGFQVLNEAGQLPGKFYENEKLPRLSDPVYLKAETKSSFFNDKIEPNTIFSMPLACRYGRYVLDSRELEMVRDENMVAFRYCDKTGAVNQTEPFNGCTESIAGIFNRKHNVLGIMAHPERALDPLMNSTDGQKMLSCLFS